MNKRNSSAYNRDVSKRKAIRKRRIAEEIYPGGKNYPWYDNYINIQKIKFIVLVLCVLRKQETKESVDIKWAAIMLVI